MKLTKAQVEALTLAVNGGLVRWPGGLWAPADEPAKDRRQGENAVPTRWVAAGTVYALDRKGCLEQVSVGETHPWSGPRRITPAGRAALAAEKPHE